jgi:hypothetical protein
MDNMTHSSRHGVEYLRSYRFVSMYYSLLAHLPDKGKGNNITYQIGYILTTYRASIVTCVVTYPVELVYVNTSTG